MQVSTLIARCARVGKFTTSLLATMSAIVLLVASGPSPAQASGSDNLPVYTSPIDITGLKLQLRAVVPDRNTGKPVEVPLPAGPLGPAMNALLSIPLSTEMDTYWANIPDSNTKIIPRDNACTGKDGIIQRLQQEVRKIGSSYSAYDISCNLASSGTLVAKQVDPYLYLGYVLTHNTVSFTVTTPYTCHAHHGTLACPDDPHLTIQFVTVLTTPVRTPDLCHITAGDGVVSVQDVNIDGSSSLTGSLAQLGDDLFLGHKFSAAERGIENTVTKQPLPLDSYLKELRNSDACSGRNPVLHRALVPFRTLDTLIQPPRGIILEAVHAGITAPTIDAPDPWGSSKPSQPTFTHPMISANQPLVVAGSSLQISGQYFPANFNVPSLANQLPISLSHGGYGANSIILGGVCWGGFTEIQWSPMGMPFAHRVAQVPGDADGACAKSYEVNNLNPANTYDFRARDCDKFTCSPLSAPLRRMTAAAGGAGNDKGTVTLIIDRNAECKAPWCGPALNNRFGQQQVDVARPSNGIAISGIPTSGECNTPLCRVSMSSTAAKVASDPPPSRCDTPLCRSAHSSAASAAANATNGGSNAPWNRPPDKSAHTSQVPIPVGSATLTPQGTFTATITVPPSLSPGAHTIWASNGNAEAEVAINVTAPNSSRGAYLMIIAIVAAGESGCPNRPTSSIAGDTNFMLFGAGFAPGNVSIYADKSTGTRPLGGATVHPDGTFCEQMRGISGRELGPHTLLAVENGTVQAQAAITVVAHTTTQVN
jgi:hypothetical protein